jgi:hypothetical protein
MKIFGDHDQVFAEIILEVRVLQARKNIKTHHYLITATEYKRLIKLQSTNRSLEVSFELRGWTIV